MKIASIIVTALLAVLGCLAGFTSVFSPTTLAYIALGIGVLGGLSTRLLPAFVPSFIPAHVEKVLADIIGTGVAVLGAITPIIHYLPNTPPAMSTWLMVATAVLGALGTALLPHTGPIKVGEDKPVNLNDEPPKPDHPTGVPTVKVLLPFFLAFTMLSQSGCNWQVIKRDIHQIEVNCDTPEVKTVALKWFMAIIVDLTQQNYGDLLDRLITDIVSGGTDIKVAVKAVACVVEEVVKGVPSESDLAGPVKPSLIPWGFVRVHAHEYLVRRAVGGCKQ